MGSECSAGRRSGGSKTLRETRQKLAMIEQMIRTGLVVEVVGRAGFVASFAARLDNVLQGAISSRLGKDEGGSKGNGGDDGEDGSHFG